MTKREERDYGRTLLQLAKLYKKDDQKAREYALQAMQAVEDQLETNKKAVELYKKAEEIYNIKSSNQMTA
ncbi:hypothetical protein P4H27_31890 [Paenibacillus taichungensis]|uniref:hypothetical protein n=1 Tax=Paenibacillus taichungensis TaxID=484184 RepID=UPI002DB7B346|nr:hypothetical protein [Paenibacillus taichungensis]MEC0111561.1 hypothetical protein [Paenibacillus taichungensis]MEC0199080.1 hypothetical protein [Paenibacillus taichungensis]